jgi:hypothetical protein
VQRFGNTALPILLGCILLGIVGMRAGAQQASETDQHLPQRSGSLNGYISFHLPRPPTQYTTGVSFYVGIWPLLDKPLQGFQIGLPSTWILPDNTDFKQPLCPPVGASLPTIFHRLQAAFSLRWTTPFSSPHPEA